MIEMRWTGRPDGFVEVLAAVSSTTTGMGAVRREKHSSPSSRAFRLPPRQDPRSTWTFREILRRQQACRLHYLWHDTFGRRVRWRTDEVEQRLSSPRSCASGGSDSSVSAPYRRLASSPTRLRDQRVDARASTMRGRAWWKSTRPAFLRTKDDPPTGGQGRCTTASCRSLRRHLAIATRRTETSRAASPCWRRCSSSYRPAARTLRRNRRKIMPRQAAGENSTAGAASRGAPPDRHTMVHARGKTAAHLVLPWIHQSSPTSKDGREASTTGCVGSICRPISMSSSFASTASAKPATLLSARSSASPPMQNPLPTAC